MAASQFDCLVLENIRVAANTHRLRLSIGEEGSLPFLPGQWVNAFIAAEDGRPWLRALSIASSPSELPNLTFYVRASRNPEHTPWTEGLLAGSKVTIKGPYGQFFMPEDMGSNLLFMVTGVGIAPALSMLRDLDRRGALESKRVLLFWGLRHENEIFCAKELRDWERDLDTFHAKIVISQPSERWKGGKGHITEAMQKRLKHFSGLEIFLVGLNEMVEDAANFFQSKGVDQSKIHRESFYYSRFHIA